MNALRESETFPHIALPVISRYEKCRFCPQIFLLLQQHLNGIHNGLLRHGLYDAAGAQNRNAADNAQQRIEGMLRQFLSLRHGNLDPQKSRIIRAVQYLKYRLKNHTPGHRIDGSFPYLLL